MRQPVDLIIHGGKVVSDQSVIEASVAIRGQTIVAVGADDAMPPAQARFDATGLHVLPGAIDSHVHFRDPGQPHKETIETGSKAAVAGGFTRVLCMANTQPVLDTAEKIAQKPIKS